MEKFDEVAMIELEMKKKEVIHRFRKKTLLMVVLDVLNNINDILKSNSKIQQDNSALINQIQNKINNF